MSEQGPGPNLGVWGKYSKNSGAWRAEASAGRGHGVSNCNGRDTFSYKLVTSITLKGGNIFLQDAFYLKTKKLF